MAYFSTKDLSVGYNSILATCLIGVMMQNGITNPVVLIVAIKPPEMRINSP